MVVLVHHADAVAPDVDAMRPLSPSGRTAAERLARETAARGVHPDVIWHSGKLRAKQTAELFRQQVNPLGTCAAVRGLQPDDPPSWMRDRLTGDTRSILIVAHMPYLPRLLRLLLDRPLDAPAEFPLHGVVALEQEGDRWSELWRLEH
jgi:phosphohistidine phosphatase